MKIGLILGRFQIFTQSHKMLVDCAYKENDLVVLFIIGRKLSLENPFTFEFRKEIIQKIYPHLLIRNYPTANLDKISDLIISELKLQPPVNLLTIYCGSDRESSYRHQLKYINKKTDILKGEIKSFDRTNKISATFARLAAFNNDKVLFKKQVPIELYSFYKKIKEEMNEAYRRLGD